MKHHSSGRISALLGPSRRHRDPYRLNEGRVVLPDAPGFGLALTR